MRNYFFFPLAHDINDSLPLEVTSSNSNTQHRSLPLDNMASPILNNDTNIIHENRSTQTENERKDLSLFSLMCNVPFFNALFYPKITNQSLNKILFYYQTYSSFEPLINLKQKIENDIYVYISSIHFGIMNNIPYIGLNDNNIDNQGTLWDDALIASKNINILVMIGGAGGAYTALFNNFEIYYDLLYQFLSNKKFIKGVDLDIEEDVKLEDVKMLINRLNADFGKDFIITMAPVASSMLYDMPGMGNFIYKSLYTSPEGSLINWYNVQCYEECSFNIYDNIIKNGYSSEKIVLGMLGDNLNSKSIIDIKDEIIKIKTTYPNMGGCILWEYSDSKINPIEWAIYM